MHLFFFPNWDWGLLILLFFPPSGSEVPHRGLVWGLGGFK